MLTAANVSSEMAVKYFVKNYYHQGKSRWSGLGAEKLGLSGAIDNEQVFKNVISGLTPDGTEQLNARVLKPDERRAALDCTFSAPKSVSLMALVGGDERLIAAHHQALKEVIALMERRYACTRVTQNNGRHRENTGNLVVAQFDHIESRDLDPHLHTHCLVMNTTQTNDGQWMSLVNNEIFANKKFLGMAYQTYLAREVQKLGYEVEPRKHGQFDIKGFLEEDLEAFSKRRQQIIALSGANSTWAEREKVWDSTRQRKQKISEDELKTLWHQEAAALGITFVQPGVSRTEQGDEVVEQKSLIDALNNAIAHLSERNVAFRQEDLEKFILEERLATDVTAIEPLIREHQELISLPGLTDQFTTMTAMRRELATIDLMQQGQGKVNPISQREVVESLLEKTLLNQGQRQAVELAALTQDQFIAWQGVAGAGKTFALKELKAIATDAGYTIIGFAPSSAAAKVLSEELEIQSETVARLLVSEPLSEIEPNQIWIVDEAGLLSAKDAHALLQRATLLQARVILVGDTRQLSAVEAGNPFKSLQQAGIKTAHLNESLRQKDPQLKLAVDLIADGRIEAGFEHLLANGSILQVDSESKIEQIANDYIVGTPEQRIKTLVLAGTNVERLALTQAIRGKLKDEGTLGEAATITQLQAKNLTKVQMRFAHNFEIGDVIMPTRDYKRRGLEKGKLYEVVGQNTDKLTLQGDNGQVLEVDTAFEKAVYQSHQIEIAVGDQLQWKKNDRKLGRRNGQEFTVTGIDLNIVHIKYADERTECISLAKAQNLDYALVSTTYSSQGKTADRVLISADFTIGQESFYVAASRARHELKIYTEDPTRLVELAQQSKAKENALELLRKQVQKSTIEQRQEQQQLPITISISASVEEPVLKKETAIGIPINKPILKSVAFTVPTSPDSSILFPVVKPIFKKGTPNHETVESVFSKPVPKPAVPTEAFWTPEHTEKIPHFIEPKDWQEFENSAIHPDITALNFESLQFSYTGGEHEAWERLMVSEKLNRTNTGRLSEGFIRAYSHLDAGGWWCDAGVDPRSFKDLTPGEKPAIKRWGCYKPNTPRPKKDEDNQIIEGKFIKYEHPPKVELSIFLLDVSEDIAERIYSKHKVSPSISDRQSGFWYCVWKYNIPCAIAEGAKKAASLLSQGHAAIGLPGISAGYRSPKDEFGKKIGKSYLHGELAVFATPNRVFKFCFDYETKPKTKQNIERDISVTGRLLQEAGARVKVVSLPGPEKGVDDFIVSQGPLAFELLNHEVHSLREWQQQNHLERAATFEPPRKQTQQQRSLQQNQIKEQTDDRQQPRPNTVINPEDRGIDNQSRETKHENRAVTNQSRELERENFTPGNKPNREPEGNERQSLELLAAISGYLELQEIEQLGADVARINQSLTDGWLRGQRTTNFSREVNPENSAVIDRTTSDVSFKQSGNAKRPTTEQLLNAITENIEQSVVESALVETLPQLTEQLYGYQQHLLGARTTLDDFGAVIASIEQQISSKRTVDVISDFIEQSVVESTLTTLLPQLLEQLSQGSQQLAHRTAIAQQSELSSSQKTVWAIAENIEQSLVESTLSIALPLLIKQLSPLRQQQKGVRSRFDDLEAVITQIEQRLSSQRAIDAITQNVEYSAVESALTETLPQLIKQFSPLRQQLKKGIATFDKIFTAIEPLSQCLDLQKTIDIIAEDIEQLAVESALSETLPQLIEQLSQHHQHISGRITKFDDLETAISQFEQHLSTKKTVLSVVENIEQSLVESALTETLPRLIEQLSKTCQQQKALKPAFDKISTRIEHEIQYLSSQRAVDAIAQNIEQSLVESIITETLPQLIEQLSQFSQQLKGGKTTFNQFKQLLDNELVGYLTQKTRTSEHLALNAISDYVAQETVASYKTVSALSKLKELLGVSQSQTYTEFTTTLQKMLDLTEKWGHHQNHSQGNVQSLSSRLTTNIEVETELSKESVKLHLKKMIQGLAREQLAEVVMEVGKYVKGEKVTGKKVSELFTSVTTDAKALTFEQKMNIVRQVIRDDKPSIMERLKINSKKPDDNGEQIRFRR